VNLISKLAALVGSAAILALTVAAEVRYKVVGVDADPPRETINIAERQGNDRALTMPTGADVKSVLSRPLFASSRRPETEQSLTVSRSFDDELPRLTGIVINDRIRLAIFQPKKPEKAIVIGIGDAIEGEKVTAISAHYVVIAGPAGERHLQPAPDASIKPAIAAVPAPRFGQPMIPLQAGGIARRRGGVNFAK
jgi:hypothetical protein